ncbi:peptidoglycan -binding protein [Acetobacteraceae bacterium H6797]|nr:peptidoglycan -binding protein [Acetobacteraceae bacterium H6797]
MSRRRQRGEALNAWPGYVDALSTLLMVIIFVLLVFVLAQGFLSVALSSRDRALDRLNRQVAELAEMLSLERGQSSSLRDQLSRAVEEARTAAQARDAAQSQLSALRDEAGRTASERDALRAERDRLAARLSDLDTAAQGGSSRIDSLQQRLTDALAQAEAAGGETARTVRELTEARRALATEREALEQARRDAVTAAAALRAAQDGQATERQGREAAERDLATTRSTLDAERQSLAAARNDLAEAQRQLEAMRREMASLDTQVRADRETIEARLSDLAKLTEQIKALTALRDDLERRTAELAARADAAERAQQAGNTALDAETRRRTAAEALAADANRRATAAEAARTAAESQNAEYARLSESARAQVALLTRQLEALRAEIARLSAVLDAEERAGRDKDAQITLLGQRLNAALAARVEELQRYRSDFFGRLRSVLGDRPEVRIVGDRFVFQGEVLFQPGSADLSDAGQQQIRSLARVLLDIAKQIPPEVNWILRVDGHADRSPLRPGARFASNWELSAARAIAVAQMLINEGLPAQRVAAAAFGEFQPIDQSDTPEARQRNRRIEFRLTDR